MASYTERVDKEGTHAGFVTGNVVNEVFRIWNREAERRAAENKGEMVTISVNTWHFEKLRKEPAGYEDYQGHRVTRARGQERDLCDLRQRTTTAFTGRRSSRT